MEGSFSSFKYIYPKVAYLMFPTNLVNIYPMKSVVMLTLIKYSEHNHYIYEMRFRVMPNVYPWALAIGEL